MSLRAGLQRVMRFEWLGEADATADFVLKAVFRKALRWRWRIAGVSGIGALFLVPLSIFALTPQEQSVLTEHEILENAALITHQRHEQVDINQIPHTAATVQQLRLHQLAEQRALRAHQAALQALPNRALILPKALLPLQMSLQQQELQRLLKLQRAEIQAALNAHRSRRFIQLIRLRQFQQLQALLAHFRYVNQQASPQALVDLDVFDPPMFDFFPHPPGAHRDQDGDFDNDTVDEGFNRYPTFTPTSVRQAP